MDAEVGRIDDLGKLLESLRPVGIEAVRIIFGRAMDRSLRELFESGKLTKLKGRGKKGKGRS